MKTKLLSKLQTLLSSTKSFSPNNSKYITPILLEIENQIKISINDKILFERENDRLKQEIVEIGKKLNLDYKEMKFKNLFVERLFLNQELELRRKKIYVLQNQICEHVKGIYGFLKTMGIFYIEYQSTNSDDFINNNEKREPINLNNDKYLENKAYKSINSDDKNNIDSDIGNHSTCNLNIHNGSVCFKSHNLLEEIKSIDPTTWEILHRLRKVALEITTNGIQNGNRTCNLMNDENVHILKNSDHDSEIKESDTRTNDSPDNIINFEEKIPLNEYGKLAFEISSDQLERLKNFHEKLEVLREEKEIAKQKNIKKVKNLCSELKIPFPRKMSLFQIEHVKTKLEKIKKDRTISILKMNKKIAELCQMLGMDITISTDLSLKNIQQTKANLRLLEDEENRRIKDIFRDTLVMLKENFEIFGLKERDFFDSEDERVILSNSNGIYFRENENKDEFERGLAETKRDSLKDQEQNKENEENVKLKSVGDNNNELENKKISNDELKINELNINNNKSNINNIENKSNMNNIDNKLNIENDSSKEKSMSNKTDSNNSSTADRDQIRNLKKLIKKMRVKIDELLPKKEQYLAIYRLIEKRQSFVQRMIEFERMASDPKRLFKNSMQLINEEKFRKNAIPQLLKIESKIFYEIKEYENLFGDFLIENVPYKMVLADEIGNRIINKNIFIYNKETPRKKH